MNDNFNTRPPGRLPNRTHDNARYVKLARDNALLEPNPTRGNIASSRISLVHRPQRILQVFLRRVQVGRSVAGDLCRNSCCASTMFFESRHRLSAAECRISCSLIVSGNPARASARLNHRWTPTAVIGRVTSCFAIPLRDELVLELARLVGDDALGARLETAFGRMAKVLALTIPERETIIRALDEAPAGSGGAPRRADQRARRPGSGRTRLGRARASGSI